MLAAILGVLKAGLGFAQILTQYLAQRELIDAGKAAQANQSLNDALGFLEKARHVETRWRDLGPDARQRLRERYKRPSE